MCPYVIGIGGTHQPPSTGIEERMGKVDSKPDVRPTLNTLYELAVRKVISHKTIVLYMFLKLHHNEPMSYRHIATYTGMSVRTLQNHVGALKALGLVRTVQGRAGKSNIYLVKIADSDLANLGTCYSSSTSTLTSLEDLLESKVFKDSRLVASKIEKAAKRLDTKSLDSVFHYYEQKPTWKSACELFSQYFSKREIDSASYKLGKRNYSKLLELWEDPDIDFKAYLKWFVEEKYKRTGWNLGIFLHEGMIAEYRELAISQAEVERHLRTSSKKQRAKHEAKAKKDEEWLSNLTLGEA